MSASILGPALAAALGRLTDYARRLSDDIPAERFAEIPCAGMNHPAFCYGHLALYPNRIARLLGHDGCVELPEAWTELFQAGATCVADDGRYPGRDAILEGFFAGHQRAAALLAETADAQFDAPNPLEGRMREIFPTIAVAAVFLTGPHVALHLGQVSAWRRAAGFGPA